MSSYKYRKYIWHYILITGILICLYAKCSAQTPPQKINAWYEFKALSSDSSHNIPIIKPGTFYRQPGGLWYNQSDSTTHQFGLDSDNVLNSNPIPLMSFAFNTVDGDSKSAFPGFYTSDTTKMWFKLVCQAMRLNGINRAVSGRALVTDSVAIFNGLTNYNGGYEFIALGINDAIQNVPQARYINCFDTLLVRLHRDHGFPYSHIGILGIDAYGGVVTPQSRVVAFNASLDSLHTVFGTFFYNIYAYCSTTGGGNYTLDSLHGRDIWNNIVAIQMARLSGIPVQSNGQRIAINGLSEFSKIRITPNDTADANANIASINPGGTIGVFKSNAFAALNPVLPQVGGLKTFGPDSLGVTNIRGSKGLKIYQAGTVQEGGKIVYGPNGLTNAMTMFAFNDAGQFRPINLETDLNSYVTIGSAFNPINFTGMDLFVNHGTASGGFSAKGANLWGGANAVHMYLVGLHGAIEAYDVSSSTPHDLTLQVIGRNVNIGDTLGCASCKVEITSSTQGFRPPVMNTTQKLAISSPVEGLQVYDITLHQMSYYNGTTWINF